MANQEHLDKLREGVEAWNQWRQEHPEIQPDLANANSNHANLVGANLSHTYLGGVDFSFANLQNANLSGSALRGVDFTVANLSGANLSSTNLWDTNFMRSGPGPAICDSANFSNSELGGVDLSHVSLSKAIFNGTELGGVNLTNANLDGTDFTNAFFAGTVFGDRDLRVVKGLETIQHRYPSPISINTIYLSQGNIPEVFLKGTGAPDTFIDYMHSLVGKAIEYSSCFISYSSDDYEIAKRLHADLQDQGVRCWFAPHDLVPGDYFREKIDHAIHMQDKLLLILSTHSMNSTWVQHEVRKALNREANQNRTILFPISLDGSVFKSPSTWAQEVREERHIGDFTQWETYEVYKQKFQTLLKQLKATEVRQ